MMNQNKPKPTPAEMILRHESTTDKNEQMDIRARVLERMRSEPEMRAIFQLLHGE